MASIWRMCCHWRKAWNRHIANTVVVYLCFFFDYGLTIDNLYDNGVLAEYKKIYFVGKAQPFKIPLKTKTAGD